MPRETRITVNLIAYPEHKDEEIILGSGSTTFFDHKGVMNSNIVELFIWPLYDTCSRIVCCDPYHGTYFSHVQNQNNSEDNQQKLFDKSDFCVIYLEFRKFANPLIYSLKSLKETKQFLRTKYPFQEEKQNSFKEIDNLYSNSLEDLDFILNSLKDKDKYFSNLNEAKIKMEKERKLLKKNDKTLSWSENLNQIGNNNNEDLNKLLSKVEDDDNYNDK